MKIHVNYEQPIEDYNDYLRLLQTIPIGASLWYGLQTEEIPIAVSAERRQGHLLVWIQSHIFRRMNPEQFYRFLTECDDEQTRLLHEQAQKLVKMNGSALTEVDPTTGSIIIK